MASNPDELYEGILTRLMNAVPSDVDKREGSIIYNALVPCALELQQIYEELEDVLKETFADTASLDYLILRANERGVTYDEATKAIALAELTFSEDLETEPTAVGSVFALENSSLMYTVIEKLSFIDNVGTYRIECNDVGTVGNVASGDLLIEEAEDDALIDNLETAIITEIDVPAKNDEEVEAFRKRYFDSINNESFGGNVADYKNKAIDQTMIGAAQIVPVWNGGGTVLIRFLNEDFDIPSAEEIAAAQNVFDPSPQGTGYGLAPIGHTVTVTGATSVPMTVIAEAEFAEGWDWPTLEPSIEAVCEDYFLELRKDWQDHIISVSPGVLAYRVKQAVLHLNAFSCTINGSSADFSLEEDEAPVLHSLEEAE